MCIPCLPVALLVTLPVELPVTLPVELLVTLPVSLPVALPVLVVLHAKKCTIDLIDILKSGKGVPGLSPFGTPSQLSVDCKSVHFILNPIHAIWKQLFLILFKTTLKRLKVRMSFLFTEDAVSLS